MKPMTDELLEQLGYRFVDVNGDLGVGYLIKERDRLREFVAAVDKAFKTNKNFIWVNGRHSFISKIRTARAKLDEEKK